MKKSILVLAIVLLTRTVFAQDFNLVKTDSLNLQFKEGFIEIHLKHFSDRYDSSYMAMTQRLQVLWNDIIKSNDRAMPYEIRYIRNRYTGEFLKVYNEPEEESDNWNVQQGKMWDFRTMRPRGQWRIYMADQERDITFIVLAQDSSGLRALLKKDLTLRFSSIREKVKTDTRRNTDPYFYQVVDTMPNGRLGFYTAVQKYRRYTGKIGFGPGLTGQQVFASMTSEVSRIFYKNLQPKSKVGIVSTVYFGKSLRSNDSGSYSSMLFYQLKYTSFLASNKLWLGVKAGYGFIERLGAMESNEVISYGLSLENTRLVDYDIDFVVPAKTNSPVGPTLLLTIKLPF